MSDEERRQFERLERRDEVKIKEYSFPERGRYQSARILDISGGGLQIETKRFFPERTQLKVEIGISGWQRFAPGFRRYLGEATNQPLVVLAEVVRCKSRVAGSRYEVALVFSGIDESQRRALIQFIKERLAATEES